MGKEKYFVLSDGDSPYKILFNKDFMNKYFNSGLFIDSFDEQGEVVTSYMYDAVKDQWIDIHKD